MTSEQIFMDTVQLLIPNLSASAMSPIYARYLLVSKLFRYFSPSTFRCSFYLASSARYLSLIASLIGLTLPLLRQLNIEATWSKGSRVNKKEKTWEKLRRFFGLQSFMLLVRTKNYNSIFPSRCFDFTLKYQIIITFYSPCQHISMLIGSYYGILTRICHCPLAAEIDSS